MTRPIQIRGGPSEFDAAVIAVVLDRIAADEKAAQAGKRGNDNRLPAWIRAVQPETPTDPLEVKKSP